MSEWTVQVLERKAATADLGRKATSGQKWVNAGGLPDGRVRREDGEKRQMEEETDVLPRTQAKAEKGALGIERDAAGFPGGRNDGRVDTQKRGDMQKAEVGKPRSR